MAGHQTFSLLLPGAFPERRWEGSAAPTLSPTRPMAFLEHCFSQGFPEHVTSPARYFCTSDVSVKFYHTLISEAEDSFTGEEFFFYKMHPQHLQVIPTLGTSPKFGILSQISTGLCLLAGDPPWECFFFKNQVEERSKAAESTSELLPPLAFLCKAIKHLYNAPKPPCLLEQCCPAP